MKKEVDNFAIQCYRACPKYHYWRIARGIVKPTEKKTAADFGSSIHGALEVFYNGGMTQDSIDKAMVYFAEEFAKSEVITDDKRTVVKGLDILGKYFTRYRYEPFNVVATEVGGAFELGEWVYRTRIDLVTEWLSPTGIYGFDHKTTSDMARMVAKPHNAITGYIYNLLEMYENVLGYQMNVIGVYKGEKKRDGNGHMVEREIFMRIPTQRTPPELAQWKKDVLHTLHQMEESYESGTFPMYAPEFCSAFRGRCGYLDLCNTDPDTQERMISGGMYESNPWKPYESEDDD